MPLLAPYVTGPGLYVSGLTYTVDHEALPGCDAVMHLAGYIEVADLDVVYPIDRLDELAKELATNG